MKSGCAPAGVISLWEDEAFINNFNSKLNHHRQMAGGGLVFVKVVSRC